MTYLAVLSGIDPEILEGWTITRLDALYEMVKPRKG